MSLIREKLNCSLILCPVLQRTLTFRGVFGFDPASLDVRVAVLAAASGVDGLRRVDRLKAEGSVSSSVAFLFGMAVSSFDLYIYVQCLL